MTDSIFLSSVDRVHTAVLSSTHLAVVTAISVNTATTQRAVSPGGSYFAKFHASSRVIAPEETIQGLYRPRRRC
jgi:hypothetical protein